jgi:nitrogen regulatory protein PII 2
MKEVMAVLRPERWAETCRRLEGLDLGESSQHRVLGRGSEGGLRYLPRLGAVSAAGIRCLPRRLACWTVEEEMVGPLVQALLEANCTGRPGDGKIFVLQVAEGYAIDEVNPLALAVHQPEPSYAARQ